MSSINVNVSADAVRGAIWLGLEKISLKIQVYNYGQDEDDNLMEALKKLQDTQFKRLVTSEIINIKFEVRCLMNQRQCSRDENLKKNT